MPESNISRLQFICFLSLATFQCFFSCFYEAINRYKLIVMCIFNVLNTVELRWLELVGTVGASLTHPYVRAIPSQAA